MFGNWLAVDRDYQNKGIASRLLKLWEKYALGVGVHAIWLWTTENNQQFYQNRGFSLAGKFPKAWFGFDHYLFYRLLRHPEEKNYLKEYLASKKAS